VCAPDKFVHMEAAAVRLAMLVGYSSVGTVEYLYNPDDGTFSFLELNPRLQARAPGPAASTSTCPCHVPLTLPWSACVCGSAGYGRRGRWSIRRPRW
jgi:hypothetical protein